MNKILVLGLLFVSTVLHANCGDLEIKIINDSSHNCTFKNEIIFFGTLPVSSIPSSIPANQASSFFLASQSKAGVDVMLNYNCDNETIQFFSYQDYCSLFSGNSIVRGTSQTSNTLNLTYATKTGNCFAGRPGQIVWRIS